MSPHPPPADALAWSRIARAVVATPYPWSPGHLVTGPDDTTLVPERLHPAFHGALDWHSCVHVQWSLVTLLLRYADALGEQETAAVVGLLGERLTAENVAAEVGYGALSCVQSVPSAPAAVERLRVPAAAGQF